MDRPFKPMSGIVSQVFLQLVVASQVNEMHQSLRFRAFHRFSESRKTFLTSQLSFRPDIDFFPSLDVLGRATLVNLPFHPQVVSRHLCVLVMVIADLP